MSERRRCRKKAPRHRGARRKDSPGTRASNIIDYSPSILHQVPSLVLVPGIVGGIDISDGPWAVTVELQYGLAFRPDVVFHASRPRPIRASRHRATFRFVEFIAHADIERPGQNRDALGH